MANIPTGSTTPGPPAHWSCDVVLTDGGTVHVRPIRPADGPAVVDFHSRLSADTIQLRFFAPKPELPQATVERYTHVDHVDHVILVAELGDELIAMASYDRNPGEREAEVAFVVADAHQGRGIGTVLLEHLAAAARERGIVRFVAETLGRNTGMLNVFRDAGFAERATLDHGVVHVELLIEPTDESRAAAEGREHRADATSIARLLTPRSVAVIGAGRKPEGIGHQVLRNLVDAGFTGAVHPVNARSRTVAGLAAHASVTEIPGEVDLAVVAVPATEVLGVARQCAEKGVAGLVVLTAGFGEVGNVEDQVQLRDIANRNGMRLVGPNCIGVINTSVHLDATFAPYAPQPGRVAMLSQSGAIGIALLERSSRIGLGVSSFASVGNKADVSGNDLLQYWEDDPQTDVVLLYLESFGNPRKFARIARRVSRRKPIVAVKAGRTYAGERAASLHTAAKASSDIAVDALFHQTGVVRVEGLDELFDTAMVLSAAPLPHGRRVAIVGNSGGPGILAADACVGMRLDVPELSEDTQQRLRRVADPNAAVANPVDLVAQATPETYERALDVVLADDAVDAVVAICTPLRPEFSLEVAEVLQRVASRADKPLVGCFLAAPDVPPMLPGDGHRAVATFSSPEAAVRALSRAAAYAEWRRRPPGHLPAFDDVDEQQASDVVRHHVPEDPEDSAWLPDDAVEGLLAAAGLIVGEGPVGGVETTAGLIQDPLFGPLVVFGLGGMVSELLDDRGFRILPLTDRDAAEMVRSRSASPMLFGYGGADPVDTGALEVLLQRVAWIADAVPEVAEVELAPVIAAPDGIRIGGAKVRVSPPRPGPPPDLRRLD